MGNKFHYETELAMVASPEGDNMHTDWRKHPLLAILCTMPAVIYEDYKNQVELKWKQFCNQNKINSYCENKCLRVELIALSTLCRASRMDDSTKSSPACLPCIALKINSMIKSIKQTLKLGMISYKWHYKNFQDNKNVIQCPHDTIHCRRVGNYPEAKLPATITALLRELKHSKNLVKLCEIFPFLQHWLIWNSTVLVICHLQKGMKCLSLQPPCFNVKH